MNHSIIQKYFTTLAPVQIAQFEQLKDLYEDWNAQINVISRKDLEEFYTRHVLHSLGIAKIISFADGSRVLDVGTGGGFPGIPLAILFPNTHFHLVDSIGKKIMVVKSVIQYLGLKNITAEQKRAEELTETYDFVVSRAVAKMPEFVAWIKDKVKSEQKNTLKNGVLYLKGGDLTEELISFSNAKEFLLPDFFEEDFFETKKVVHLPI